MILAGKKRIDWIDISKGIGVLLLVIGHMPSIPYFIQNWIYSFHMPLFFVLSGYTYKQRKTFKDEIIVSLKHLLVPYLIYNCIFLINDILLFGFDSEIVKGDILNIYTGQGSYGVIWFLLSMFWVRNIYSIVYRMTKAIMRFSIITGIVIVGYIISVFTELDLFKFVTSLVAVGFFYIGNVIKEKGLVQSIFKNKKQLLYIIFWVIGSLFLSYLNLKIYNQRIELSGAIYNFILLTYCAAICGFMTVICCSYLISNAEICFNSVLKHIGQYSLWYFPLTAYIPVRMMQLLNGTILDNVIVKIFSKLLGFFATYLLIYTYHKIKNSIELHRQKFKEIH